MIITGTVERVRNHTEPHINRKMDKHTERNISRFAGDKESIERRLKELEAEWDLDRALEVNASAMVIMGSILGLKDRRWLVLPIAAAAFVMQHALQGWCPPAPVVRRMGFRTAFEIDEERYALKAARGDFSKASPKQAKKGRTGAKKLLKAARR